MILCLPNKISVQNPHEKNTHLTGFATKLLKLLVFCKVCGGGLFSRHKMKPTKCLKIIATAPRKTGRNAKKTGDSFHVHLRFGRRFSIHLGIWPQHLILLKR